MLGARSVPAQHGGLEVAAEQLSVELARRGHEVRAIVDGPGLWREHQGVRVRGVRCVRTKHLHTITQTLASLPLVVRDRPDIAHFHGVGPGMLGVVPRFRGVPTVVTVQGLDWERDKWSRAASRSFGMGVRLSLGRADAVIAVSQTLRDALRSRLGIESHYIPNGVRIPDAVTTTTVLEELHVKPNEYVLFAARLVPEKGAHYLLDAYRELGSNIPLVIAGSGGASYADDYEQSLRQSAPPGVIFAGFRTGVALQELFAHCRAYVLPSVMEGLPLSLLEAMSHSRPVIHSAIPECEEVTRGDAGRTFRTRDAADLARVLGEVLADEPASARIGKAGRIRVETDYTWPRIAEETERVFRSL